MALFHVDSAELAAAGAATSQLAESLRTQVAAMMAQLSSLQSSWNGQASATFADCAARWHTAQIQIEDVLNQIGQALAQASATYDDAEAAAAGLFTH